MKKIYHLATCSTCQKILKIWKPNKDYVLQDIKTEKITPVQLDDMINLAGSAEALFSRRSLKYQSMGLKDKKLTEKDYRKLILEEYTFLKRPVLISGKKIFIGNAPTVVKEAKSFLDSLKK
jgi:arsenate reductase